MRLNEIRFLPIVVWTVAAFVFALSPGFAVAQVADRVSGQVIYVPSYSRVLTKEGHSQPMATTLVVHNVDPESQISVSNIDYYDRGGHLQSHLVPDTVILKPFESTDVLVPIDNVSDGFGANFIVVWSSEAPALPPLVEAIFVGGSGTHGISFSSRGHVISETR